MSKIKQHPLTICQKDFNLIMKQKQAPFDCTQVYVYETEKIIALSSISKRKKKVRKVKDCVVGIVEKAFGD